MSYTEPSFDLMCYTTQLQRKSPASNVQIFRIVGNFCLKSVIWTLITRCFHWDEKLSILPSIHCRLAWFSWLIRSQCSAAVLSSLFIRPRGTMEFGPHDIFVDGCWNGISLSLFTYFYLVLWNNIALFFSLIIVHVLLVGILGVRVSSSWYLCSWVL